MKPVIGFTAGAWDLLHAGHSVFLTKCFEQCDHMVIGLHTNPKIDRFDKNVPVQTTFERYLQLRSLNGEATIVPYDTERDLVNILATIGVNRRFLGSDYEGKEFTGKAFCEDNNIELVYIPRKHNFSSSELRNRIKESS